MKSRTLNILKTFLPEFNYTGMSCIWHHKNFEGHLLRYNYWLISGSYREDRMCSWLSSRISWRDLKLISEDLHYPGTPEKLGVLAFFQRILGLFSSSEHESCYCLFLINQQINQKWLIPQLVLRFWFLSLQQVFLRDWVNKWNIILNFFFPILDIVYLL